MGTHLVLVSDAGAGHRDITCQSFEPLRFGTENIEGIAAKVANL